MSAFNQTASTVQGAAGFDWREHWAVGRLRSVGEANDSVQAATSQSMFDSGLRA